MTEPPFLGPAWARATQCCGKPVGCTNMSEQCRMTGHPWKRWHREEFGPPCPECDGTGLVPDPSACGDPDHCAGWMPCPRGCAEPGNEAIEPGAPTVLLSVSR